MEFSNLFFLYLFLPLGVGIYFLTPGIRGKNIVLLALSLLFYAYGELRTLPLLLVLSGINYLLGKKLFENRLLLCVSLGLNISVLVICKVFLESLPLGLSFYCFSLITYVVGVYRGKTQIADSFVEFLLFVCLFPKLLMGPIVRYEMISEQLKYRDHDPKKIYTGCVRFFLGLGSKILLADPLYELYAQLFAQNSTLSAWVAALCFMLYIYFEFSGYAHMAVGLGQIFGLTLPENFYRPYTAATISDFWRRWHISLGNFFRDYVYIPLGGNRKGIYRQWLNLFVVWVLTGLWHGFTLPFVLWGLYYFVLSLLEKTVTKTYCKIPKLIRIPLTQFFVLMGWVIFAAKDGHELYYSLAKMFLPSSGSNAAAALVLRNSLLLLGIAIALALFGGGVEAYLQNKVSSCNKPFLRGLCLCITGLVMACILILCTASLLSAGAKPSMYASF